VRLDYSDRQVIRAAFVCEAAALVIGIAGGCGYWRSPLSGLTQGAATFGNSGVEMGQTFALKAWQTHVIVLPLVTLGGLGITVLMELYDLVVHGQRISTHARVVLAWACGVYLVAVVVLTAFQWIGNEAEVNGERFGEWVASSSIAAINSRTSGIPFQYAHEYRRPMQWAVVVLMMIGGASGGTAGGVKTTTIATMTGGTRRLLRGESGVLRPLGIALTWVGIYLAIAFGGLIMLLFVQPQLAADRALFLTISALSNVGLSHDTLPEMQRGAYVLAALMLAGRMVPLLILWWMADSTEGAEVAVG
jgi:trk/ktr system potassium uptake protein